MLDTRIVMCEYHERLFVKINMIAVAFSRLQSELVSFNSSSDSVLCESDAHAVFFAPSMLNAKHLIVLCE